MDDDFQKNLKQQSTRERVDVLAAMNFTLLCCAEEILRSLKTHAQIGRKYLSETSNKELLFQTQSY